MKKLICVAAALTAGICVADISSSNIVGYQNLDLNDKGNTMTTPTFASVSIDGKFTLADIKVAGYAPSWFDSAEEQCWVDGALKGKIILQSLTKGGVIDAQYFWLDYIAGDDPDPKACTVYTAGWYTYDKGTNKYAKMTEVEQRAVEFGQGQAFWFYNFIGDTASQGKVKLVPAGAVSKADVAFKLNDKGNTGVGIARPTSVTLGELTVTGYAPSWFDSAEEQCWVDGALKGKIILQTLTKGGVIDEQYFWLDYVAGDDPNPDNCTVYSAGWYTYDKGTNKYTKLTVGELESISFEAGDGFWFYNFIGDAASQGKVKLNVPSALEAE